MRVPIQGGSSASSRCALGGFARVRRRPQRHPAAAAHTPTRPPRMFQETLSCGGRWPTSRTLPPGAASRNSTKLRFRFRGCAAPRKLAGAAGAARGKDSTISGCQGEAWGRGSGAGASHRHEWWGDVSRGDRTPHTLHPQDHRQPHHPSTPLHPPPSTLHPPPSPPTPSVHTRQSPILPTTLSILSPELP